MSKPRVLNDEEIAECTGARVGDQESKFEVQLDGAWIVVDHDSYERVREIQDSCA